MKRLSSQGLGTKKRAEPVTADMIEELWLTWRSKSSSTLGHGDLHVQFIFCSWSGQEHCNLRRDKIELVECDHPFLCTLKICLKTILVDYEI